MTTVGTKVLVPNEYKHEIAELYRSDIASTNNIYYLFLSDHTDRESEQYSAPEDTVNQLQINSYHSMIMGKQITSDDVTLLIKDVPYEANVIYTMYDDQVVYSEDPDDDISSNFYVVVNASSFYHIFKCLDNNMGGYSTVQPDFSHISGANTIVYQTSDGYRWKYMYSVSAAQKTKFATNEYFPVVANTTVEDAAVVGAVDIIKIETAGLRYDNYFNGTFSADDIRVGGNNLIYQVTNSVASTINGYYTGCLMYISTGTGSGQYKTIANYFANSSGKYAVVNNAFTTTPAAASQFQINPRINIIGSGEQTVNAVARALINSSSSNSIYRIEVLERGAGYRYLAANVVANAVVAIAQQADIRPIYSPSGGHGSDPAAELRANKLAVSVKFQNTESNTILTSSHFQQLGIIKNPQFANVNFQLANVIGTFTSGELVYKITPRRFNRSVVCNTTSNVVSTVSGDFENQIDVGEMIIITTAEKDAYWLANVGTITNATHITITSNGGFACTSGYSFYPNVSGSFILSDVVDLDDIMADNVTTTFATGDMVIGVQSGAVATINAITRNAVEKDFDTFIALHKYTGTISSGSFIENEVVTQGNSSAVLHSAINRSGTYDFYTSNQVGQFLIVDTINTISGNTSTAVAQLQDKYQPEIVFGSGVIMMIENIDPKTRANNQTETFKVIFDF